MLYCVAYFIIFVHYNIAYAFLHVQTGTRVGLNRTPLPPCASFLHACRSKYLNIWCVYVESLLNICILLHIWLVSFIHIYIYPF